VRSPTCWQAGPVQRASQSLLLVLVGAVALAACSAGPSTRPAVALLDGKAPPAPTSSAPPALQSPPLQAPVADLPWSDCTASTLGKLALTSRQAGLVLDCATVSVPLDPKLAGTVPLGLLRARVASTPRDAAPLVLTTGVEQPSTTALATLAASGSAALLATRPLVAADRRGVGTSAALTCLKPAQRTAIEDVDASAPADPLAATLQLGRDATQACTDAISPAEAAFDTTHAAEDLEVLRTTWKVDRLSLLGMGDGAAIALRYAVLHPEQVARLVLDSPAVPGADEVSLAKDQAIGAEAAFAAFATSCAAVNCPAGADPRRAVTDLMQRARAAAPGLVGAAGRRLSAGGILRAVREALRTPAGSQGLGPALAAANGGDPTALLAYLDQSAGRAVAGNPGTAIDDSFVGHCSDAALRPTPGQVSTLVAQWRKDYPLFGADAAARLLLCLSWPTPPTAPAVKALNAVPPALLVSPTADPVVGAAGTPATLTDVQQAGSDGTVLSWQSTGHPVFLSSPCTRDAVGVYLAEGKRPRPGTICPP